MLKMIQAFQQKPNEYPEFLERTNEVHGKPTDAFTQAAGNVQMVSMTFIGPSAPDIREKLQHLDGH